MLKASASAEAFFICHGFLILADYRYKNTRMTNF